MKLLTTVFLLLSLSLSASDNRPLSSSEEAKAITACMRAMNVLEKRDVKNRKENLTSVCDFNTKTARHWSCVEKRLKEGQSLQFASTRCEESGAGKKRNH